LLLPTGGVLLPNGLNEIEVQTSAGDPDPVWKPSVAYIEKTLRRGAAHCVQRRQINGPSQAVSHGDDAQMATNYPTIRLGNITPGSTSYGLVVYCRTVNHSTLNVSAGTTYSLHSLPVPPNADAGAHEIQVVANGIASDSVPIDVV
jgi:hypothetical protein